MEAREVILAPVVTENSMGLIEDKKYTFSVDTRANKFQVRDAIEEIFDVKVKKVNMMNVKPKKKRMGQYLGKTNKKTKAIVTLTNDSKEIQLFDNK